MKKLAMLALLGVAGASFGQVLYDNGPFDGQNGLSNGNFGGLDRRVYDDFKIADPAWIIKDVHIKYLWNGSGAGKTTKLNVWFYKDSGGAPDLGSEVVGNVTSFTDVNAGQGQLFGRDIVEISGFGANIATLGTGMWWVAIQPVGPENGFQLTAGVKNNPVYIKYSDFGNTLMPGRDVFGVDYDVDFKLTGSIVPEPASILAISAGIAALAARRRRK